MNRSILLTSTRWLLLSLAVSLLPSAATAGPVFTVRDQVGMLYVNMMARPFPDSVREVVALPTSGPFSESLTANLFSYKASSNLSYSITDHSLTFSGTVEAGWVERAYPWVNTTTYADATVRFDLHLPATVRGSVTCTTLTAHHSTTRIYASGFQDIPNGTTETTYAVPAGYYHRGLELYAEASHTYGFALIPTERIDFIAQYEFIPRPIHGLFVGSTHVGWCDGVLDADKVEEAMVGLCQDRKRNFKRKNFGYSNPEGRVAADVLDAVDSFTQGPNKVEPHDTFVFFYSGHGFGGLGMQEALVLTHELPGALWDNDLVNRFRGEAWNEVNKLFILDACHSGGFWESDDQPGGLIEKDLQALPRTAILAACPETGETHSTKEKDYRGWFSMAIEEGLSRDASGYANADKNKTGGVTFGELEAWIEKYIVEERLRETYVNFEDPVTGNIDYAGYIKAIPDPNDTPELEWFRPTFYAWASDDFDGALTEGWVIPEPSTLVLLSMGAVALLAYAWRRRR